MFKDLHSQRYNGFSTMITKYTRNHLFKDVKNNEKDTFSSKYLRIASIHQNGGPPGCILFQEPCLIRSQYRHYQEMYLDQNILAPTFQGEYDLNGWVDETPQKTRPKFSFPWTSRDGTRSFPDKGVVHSVCTTVQEIWNSLPCLFIIK